MITVVVVTWVVVGTSVLVGMVVVSCVVMMVVVASSVVVATAQESNKTANSVQNTSYFKQNFHGNCPITKEGADVSKDFPLSM